MKRKKADAQNTVQDEEPSGESDEEGLDYDSEYYDEEEEAANRRRLPTGSLRRARTGVAQPPRLAPIQIVQPQKTELADKEKHGKESARSAALVCRICLSEESDDTNPLISPCKCAGTMKMIHIECLREWLNSKCSVKTNESVKTYCWKAMECELCKHRLPERIIDPRKSVVNEHRKYVDLLTFEKPRGEYMVLESVTQQNVKIVHVIDMDSRSMIRVGRGHDC